MPTIVIRIWLFLILVVIQGFSQIQNISVGGPWSDFPTLTEAIASLPMPLLHDVRIVVEQGSEGVTEPDLTIDMAGLGAGGHFLVVDANLRDLKSSQNGITYYVGDDVEYRVAFDKTVKTILNYGGGARQVHNEQGTDEPKDYQLRDHLGSVVTTVDEAGTPNGPLLEYDALGRQEVVVGSSLPALTESFTGKEYDVLDPSDASSMGLYHFGARSYDPDVGIWISPDAVHQFNSPYAYSTNPINSVDADGNYVDVVDNNMNLLGCLDPSAFRDGNLIDTQIDEMGRKLSQGITVLSQINFSKEGLFGAQPSIFNQKINWGSHKPWNMMETITGSVGSEIKAISQFPKGWALVKGLKSSGQEVYKRGMYYISRDITEHNVSNGWKVWDKLRNVGKTVGRGTYDEFGKYLKK